LRQVLVILILISLTLAVTYAPQMICLAEELRKAIYITVFSDGSALVSEIFSVPDAITVNVSLISVPFSNVVFVIDENGTFLYSEVINGTLLEVYTYGARIINVTYVTETLTVKEQDVLGTWRLKLQSECPLTIRLPEDAVLLNITLLPDRILKEDKWTVLEFSSANITIEYMIVPQITVEKPPEEEISTPVTGENATTGTETTAGTTKKSIIARLISTWIIVVIVAIVVLVMLVLLMRRRRYTMMLDEREREVINILKKLGGRAPQYEICERLGIPKSSMSRIIRRLEEKGMIRVIKSGRYNIIELK